MIHRITPQDIAAGRLPDASTGVRWDAPEIGGYWTDCRTHLLRMDLSRLGEWAIGRSGAVLYGEVDCDYCSVLGPPSLTSEGEA